MSEQNNAERDDSGFGWKLWAALGLVAVIVALGIILSVANLFDGGGEKKESSGDSPSTSAAPSGEATKASDKSKCGLPGYAASGTVTKAPAKTEWTIVGTTAAPKVGKAGPGKIDGDGYRQCFAHTPEGAVVAAANYFALTSDYSLDKKLATDGMAKGKGRDASMKSAGSHSSSGVRAQIEGFSVVSYSGTKATVDIAFRMSSGEQMSAPYFLVWEDGDWKMQVNDDGGVLAQPQQITSLDGYVPWAGA